MGQAARSLVSTQKGAYAGFEPTILLVRTALTILLPLLRLGLAHLTRRRISSVWIFRLGTEKFTLVINHLVSVKSFQPLPSYAPLPPCIAFQYRIRLKKKGGGYNNTFPIPVFPNVALVLSALLPPLVEVAGEP